MAKGRRSTDELIAQLQEQIDFLRASAAAFDGGNIAEAKRMATTVRVLVHDTNKSHALLKQLGVLHRLSYLDTCSPIPPNSHVPPSGASPGTFSIAIGSGLAPLEIGPSGARYVAPLDDPGRPRNHAPFSQWWTAEIARAPGRHQLTRKKVTLGLANFEGGAHIDPFPEMRWTAMASGGAFGDAQRLGNDDKITVTVSLPLGPDAVSGDDSRTGQITPVPASMRQIAFELDETLTAQLFQWAGYA